MKSKKLIAIVSTVIISIGSLQYFAFADESEAVDEVISESQGTEVVETSNESASGVEGNIEPEEESAIVETITKLAGDGEEETKETQEDTDIEKLAAQSDVDDLEENHTHIYDDGVVTKEATCTEDGEKTCTCITCGKSTVRPISASHKLRTISSKKVTCVEEGYSKMICTVCGAMFNHENIIPPTGKHLWMQETKSDGTIATVCRTCGTVYSESEYGDLENVHTHDFVNLNTCVGEKCGEVIGSRVCKTCFFDEDYVVTPGTTEHVFEEKIKTPATCQQKGLMIFVCKNCGFEDYAEDEIPKIEHIASEPVKENISGGKADFVTYCTMCNKQLSRERRDCTGIGTEEKHNNSHKLNGPVRENIIEPTHNEKGSYDSVVYCKDCGIEVSRERIETEATSNHIEGNYEEENRVEATCTSAGSYDEVRYCAVCNKELSRKRVIINIKNHNFLIEEIKPATCKQEGESLYTCKVCGFSKNVVIPQKDHKYNAVFETDKAATCLESGLRSKHCMYCGKKKDSEDIPALGHEYIHHVGSDISSCKRCGALINDAGEEIQECADGEHVPCPAEKENIVEPSDGKNGSYDLVVYCEKCDKELSRENKSICAEHEYGVGKLEIKPTCKNEGLVRYKCNNCDATKISIRKMTDHTYESGSKKCSVCGYEQTTGSESGSVGGTTGGSTGGAGGGNSSSNGGSSNSGATSQQTPGTGNTQTPTPEKPSAESTNTDTTKPGNNDSLTENKTNPFEDSSHKPNTGSSTGSTEDKVNSTIINNSEDEKNEKNTEFEDTVTDETTEEMQKEIDELNEKIDVLQQTIETLKEMLNSVVSMLNKLFEALNLNQQ